MSALIVSEEKRKESAIEALVRLEGSINLKGSVKRVLLTTCARRAALLRLEGCL